MGQSKSQGHAETAADTRKLRNRLSQRAFRARQSVYIKELEEKLKWATKPDYDINTRLEEENKKLRSQLLDCQKKLDSLIVSMELVSKSLTKATDIESDVRDQSQSRSPSLGIEVALPNNPAQPNAVFEDDSILPDFDSLLFQEGNDITTTLNSDQQECSPTNQAGPMTFDFDTLEQNPPAFYAQIEHGIPFNSMQSFSFKQMMGVERYAHIASTGSSLTVGKMEFQSTNSAFSDHISSWEHYLRSNWHRSAGLLTQKTDSLMTAAYFMVSSFICLSWPLMTSWHTYTRAHIPVLKLTAWHIDPSPQTYNAMTKSWRPTQLQLSSKHPSIIDWIPFPTLRDKLISCHAANPCLDDVICEIGNSYVMETDLSKLIANIPPTEGYVSVWDLVRAISPQTTRRHSDANTELSIWDAPLGPDSYSDLILDLKPENEEAPAPALPAPDIKSLFSSKSLALQCFKLLGMDRGACFFRLDPAFFENHPELYDPRENLMARGVPLRSPNRVSMSVPPSLDTSVLEQYKNISSWTVDLLTEGVLPATHLNYSKLNG